MKYFLHDCNSFNDDKVSELFLKFGYEGLGLFYTILERIGSQEKPIKTIVLKSQLKVGKKLDKCWEFMESLGLISSNNGDTFNERILSYSETYQIKKEKNKEKILQWRKNQLVTENVTSYEPVRNPSKVNESKVNESKVNIVAATPESIFDKLDIRGKKIFEMFRRNLDREKYTDVALAAEVNKFQNRYPEIMVNNCGALVNTWCSNIGKQNIANGRVINHITKKEIYV